MKYPRVDHAHIVPENYLANFAVNGMIGMRLVGEARSKIVSTKDAAVRKAFYSRTRPDGTRIDDVEWSLSEVESASAQLLRSAAVSWPLSLEDKVKLAELFAFQLIRGPKWKDWHEDFTRGFVAEREAADPAGLLPTEARHIEQLLLTDTHRLGRMLSLGVKVTAVLASMHWVRVDLARPLVVTSDHPVVVWPMSGEARRPERTTMNLGVLETLEVRVPISPQHAVLMTWRDAPDDAGEVVAGKRDHAANLNAFTVAEADRQWFHQPGSQTPIASGKLLPLSSQLFRDYGASAAGGSRRRALTSANLQPMVGQALASRDINVVVQSSRGT